MFVHYFKFAALPNSVRGTSIPLARGGIVEVQDNLFQSTKLLGPQVLHYGIRYLTLDAANSSDGEPDEFANITEHDAGTPDTYKLGALE